MSYTGMERYPRLVIEAQQHEQLQMLILFIVHMSSLIPLEPGHNSKVTCIGSQDSNRPKNAPLIPKLFLNTTSALYSSTILSNFLLPFHILFKYTCHSLRSIPTAPFTMADYDSRPRRGGGQFHNRKRRFRGSTSGKPDELAG